MNCLTRCAVLLALIVALQQPLPADDRVAEDSAADDRAAEALTKRNIEGWTVVIDPQLQTEEHREVYDKAAVALANHLQRIKYIMPADRATQLMELPIWLDLNHPRIKSMQYHPSRQWLIDHDHDPRLAQHVHIPCASELYNPGTWAKHPYVVLHELAHAYHDQVLGFDHEAVRKVYDEAKQKKIYEDVLLHTGGRAKHYALTDHKEYFAEITEAYWGVNDFYPFVRAELKEHDASGFALMEAIWGKAP